MDNLELKRKLLNTTIIEEIAKDEILKKLELIQDYKLETSIENFDISDDGILEYDVIIHHKIVPKKSVENVIVDFTVTPNIK